MTKNIIQLAIISTIMHARLILTSQLKDPV